MNGHSEEFKYTARGFILVELIVVLAIVALAAAIFLPMAYSSVRVAKEKAEIAETQTATLTLQAVLTITYGKAVIGDKDGLLSITDLIYFDTDDVRNVKLTEMAYREMKDLAGVNFGVVENIVLESNIVLASFRYYTLSGSTVDYNNGQYFVVELY